MSFLDAPDRLARLRETGLLDSPAEEDFDRLTRLASQLLEAPVALVSLVDIDRQYIKSAVGMDAALLLSRDMPIAYSYCQHALASPDPLAIEDARLHPLVKDSPAVTENGSIAYLGVPLLGAGHVLGTLCVVDRKPRQWTNLEISALRDIAAIAQSNIDLRLSEQRAQHHHVYLHAVVDAQQAIAASALDLEGVMQLIVDRARTLTRAEAAVVELAEGSEMVYRAGGGTAGAHVGLRLEMADSISGLCVRTNRILRSDDTEADERVNQEACRKVGARSLVVVPLKLLDGALGVLKVYSPRPAAFTDVDVQTLQLMAALLSSALSDGHHRAVREELVTRLQVSEALYHSVFDGVEEGLFVIEREGDGTFHYAAANSALGRMLGLSCASITGRRPDELVTPAMAEEEEARFRQVITNGETVEAEYPLEIATRTATVRTRLYPLPSESAAGLRILGIIEDVTTKRDVERLIDSYARELERSNAELERSNRELQDFAYVASHDLQEPLRKIQAFGDRLQSRFRDALGEQGADYIERMQAAAGRMQVLIADLLAYSRVHSKAAPFQLVSLKDVVRDVLVDLQQRMQDTGGVVEVGTLSSICADSLQMRQLLQNLIGNALKFHRDGVPPRIHVSSTVREDERVELQVQDNGIGFDEQYLDRIFTPFERLHSRHEFEGTGMGLAICRRIAERHGGSITARSVRGEGTTFIVTLGRVERPDVEAGT